MLLPVLKKAPAGIQAADCSVNVYLQVQNPTHIARHGIYITTPEVALDEAIVAIQVEVEWLAKT